MSNWQWVTGTDEQGEYRQLVDIETGEFKPDKIRDRIVGVPDGKSAQIVDPTRSKKEKDKQPYYYQIYRTNWMDIVRKKKLTMQERGVLTSLLVCLSWESNYLVHPETGEILSLTKLAEVLVADRKQLGKTMETLTEKGLVATIARGNGRENAYQLNSNVLYYGRMMRDVNEHKVFDDCAYEPIVRKQYRQRTNGAR